MVTHSGLTAGYQVAQTAHAVANFARYETESFIDWHSNSQYIVALATPCADSLHSLLLRAKRKGLVVVPFREPDLEDQLTSLAFVPNEHNKKLLSNLPLAGKNNGKTNKHTTTKEKGHEKAALELLEKAEKVRTSRKQQIASLKRLIAKGERELKQLEDEVETAKSTVSAVNSGGN